MIAEQEQGIKMQIKKYQNRAAKKKIKQQDSSYLIQSNHGISIYKLNPKKQLFDMITIDQLSGVVPHKEIKELIKLELENGMQCSIKFARAQDSTLFIQNVNALIDKRKNMPNYIEFMQKFESLKQHILKKNPHLTEIYIQFSDKISKKSNLCSKQVFDRKFFEDHAEIKKFFRIQAVQSYEVEKKILDTFFDQEQFNTNAINDAFMKFDKQPLDNYSVRKQLEGVKLSEDDKKNSVEAEKQLKQDIFLLSILEQQRQARQEMEIQVIHAGKVSIPKVDEITFCKPITIQPKTYHIRQTIQISQSIPIINKKPNISEQTQRVVKKLLEYVRLMYKFMKIENQDMVLQIRQSITQNEKKLQENLPHIKVFLNRANQNFLTYRKGKLIL